MSKLEELQTTVANLEEKVDDTLLALEDVKRAIISNGVEVADGTPVSEYAGKIEGLYESGKRAEYDTFWDVFQANGNRVNYQSAFHSPNDLKGGFTSQNFYPKYDIKPTNMSFFLTNFSTELDLIERFKECGIEFDTSNCNNFQQAFVSCTGITAIPKIDLSKGGNCNQMFFDNFVLKTLEIVFSNKTTLFNNGFDKCYALENLTVYGEIVLTNLNLKWSTKLSKSSITSVINALSDTTTSQAVTISLTAVNNAFATAEEFADGSTSQEWLDLIATKPNWTISLQD